MRKPGRKFEELEVRHNGEVETLEIRIGKDDGNVVYHALHEAKDIDVSDRDYRKCVTDGIAQLKSRMGATIRDRILVRLALGEPSHHYGDAVRRDSAGVSLTVFRFQESVAADGTIIATRTSEGEGQWTKVQFASSNHEPGHNGNRRAWADSSTVVLDYDEALYVRLQNFVKALEALGDAINREMYPDKLALLLLKMPGLAAPEVTQRRLGDRRAKRTI